MTDPIHLLDLETLNPLLDLALAEDHAGTDVTTLSLFADTDTGCAILRAKEPGVIAGLPVVEQVFHKLDPAIKIDARVTDGHRVCAGDIIAEVSGPIRALLSGERLALNLFQRMCGIATAAAAYADAVKDLPVKILDTRKTAPGLRILDKYAGKVGGITNHRMSLSDLAMIKDNHLRLAGGITAAVQKIRAAHPDIHIEVETETLADVREALAAKADIIMLDNMELDTMREAVALIGNQAETEASGNVTLERVRAIAETGENMISVGALTHSVKAMDISMKVETRSGQ